MHLTTKTLLEKTRGLRFRVFAISLVAVSLFSITLTAVFVSRVESASDENLVHMAGTVGALLAGNLAAPMDFAQLLEDDGESEDGTTILKTAVANKDLIYAIAYGPTGSVFARAGKTPKDAEKRFSNTAHDTTTYPHQIDGSAIHLKIPVSLADDKTGTLYLGMSRQSMDQMVRGVIRYVIPWSAAVSVLIVAVLFFLISRTTVTPILTMTRLLSRVGEGDIRPFSGVKLGTNTAEIVAMYEALELATQSFRENIVSILNVVSELAATSETILETAEALSTAGTQQASAVAETTVTIDEVKRTGQVTADNARDIQVDADSTRDLSRKGLQAVENTRQQLSNIQQQVDAIVESANDLNTQLVEVDRIVASVAGVTQQSHTLSINASIEAVKAGAAGKGFAVVARQIRTLSQESREATEVVQQTLTAIQAGIAAMARTSEEGRNAAHRGVDSMERTGQLIRRVGDSIEKSTHAATSIAHNTQQQATGLEQTAFAMGEINQATQRHLESIDSLRARGDELKEWAMSLQSLVDLFKVDD